MAEQGCQQKTGAEQGGPNLEATREPGQLVLACLHP